MATIELSGDHIPGLQQFFGDKLAGQIIQFAAFDKRMIRARIALTQPVKAKVTFTNKDTISVSSFITFTNSLRDMAVPIADPIPASWLPRPYPAFITLQFKGTG